MFQVINSLTKKKVPNGRVWVIAGLGGGGHKKDPIALIAHMVYYL